MCLEYKCVFLITCKLQILLDNDRGFLLFNVESDRIKLSIRRVDLSLTFR